MTLRSVTLVVATGVALGHAVAAAAHVVPLAVAERLVARLAEDAIAEKASFGEISAPPPAVTSAACRRKNDHVARCRWTATLRQGEGWWLSCAGTARVTLVHGSVAARLTGGGSCVH